MTCDNSTSIAYQRHTVFKLADRSHKIASLVRLVREYPMSDPSAGPFATPVAGLAVLRQMQLAMWSCTSLPMRGSQLVLVTLRVTIAARQIRSLSDERIYPWLF
jgi:hypothetical protein